MITQIELKNKMEQIGMDKETIETVLKHANNQHKMEKVQIMLDSVIRKNVEMSKEELLARTNWAKETP